VRWLQPDWPAIPSVRAAMSLRPGGGSPPPFESLNLADHVGDDPVAVHNNRLRLQDALGLPAEPLWLAQVHGTQVLQVDEASAHAPAPPVADAAITRTPGRVLAVLIADCLPVLFARTDGSAIGVAHAGWRGLAGGVLEATVQALGVPAEALQAWLGPGICAQHFEVGEEVRASFCAHAPHASEAFERNARGRWQCDLYRLARQRLEALGVSAVYGGGHCTYGEPEAFFSYRRDGATGRMAALIWLDRGAAVMSA
jgi:YfiH family protein